MNEPSKVLLSKVYNNVISSIQVGILRHVVVVEVTSQYRGGAFATGRMRKGVRGAF